MTLQKTSLIETFVRKSHFILMAATYIFRRIKGVECVGGAYSMPKISYYKNLLPIQIKRTYPNLLQHTLM